MIVIIPPNSFKVLGDGTMIANITDLSKMPSVLAAPTSPPECQSKAMPGILDRMDVEAIYKEWCINFHSLFYAAGNLPNFKELSESHKIAWNNFVYSLHQMQ